MRQQIRINLWASLLVVFAFGCGGGAVGKGPKLPAPVPVKGQVFLDGNPLPSATVAFVPQGTNMGSGANAVTNAEGTYELVLDTGAKGAIPGNYKVWISSLIGPDNKPVVATASQPPADLGAREALPPKYSDLTQSMLKASVGDQGGVFDFRLNSK